MSKEESRNRGRIFVISAPSGAGKTTLCRMVLKRFKQLSYSISHTTRSPRAGEKDGVDYFFISREEFEERIQKKRWAEWALVHDNYYGTSLDFIQDKIKEGVDLLLDIDVQGARLIKASFPEAITIFIAPPSFKVLEERLRKRGTDSQEVIQKRLRNAGAEMDQQDFYEHVVVNDDLDRAALDLASIFEGVLG